MSRTDTEADSDVLEKDQPQLLFRPQNQALERGDTCTRARTGERERVGDWTEGTVVKMKRDRISQRQRLGLEIKLFVAGVIVRVISRY